MDRRWFVKIGAVGVAGASWEGLANAGPEEDVAVGKVLGDVYRAVDEVALNLGMATTFGAPQKEFTVALIFAGICDSGALAAKPTARLRETDGQFLIPAGDAETVGAVLSAHQLCIRSAVESLLESWKEQEVANVADMVGSLVGKGQWQPPEALPWPILSLFRNGAAPPPAPPEPPDVAPVNDQPLGLAALDLARTVDDDALGQLETALQQEMGLDQKPDLRGHLGAADKQLIVALGLGYACVRIDPATLTLVTRTAPGGYREGEQLYIAKTDFDAIRGAFEDAVNIDEATKELLKRWLEEDPELRSLAMHTIDALAHKDEDLGWRWPWPFD